MKTTKKIYGFHDRVQLAINLAIAKKGLTTSIIANEMGINKNHLYSDNQWGSYKVMKFCAVTGVSADWLLGLRGGDPYD